jgi:hypothetical protein
VIDVAQNSAEWHQLKCGWIGASRIGDLMATTKKGRAASRKNYFNELLAQRLTGRRTSRYIYSLNNRLEMEPEARAAYEFYTGNSVVEVGFIPHPQIDRAGASPDGIVSDDGGLEIKCCDAGAHIAMIETGIIDPAYLYQCQFGMACSERSWWDFVAYHPDMPEELKFWTKRIERDDHCIERIEQAVRDFDAEIEAKIAALRLRANTQTRPKSEPGL